MVLPGIQAVFGFQLIAFFNSAFDQKMGHAGAVVHLVALICVAIAAALTMAPAAFHRLVAPKAISERLLRQSSRFLLASMVFLTAGLCLDVALVARTVVGDICAAVVTTLLGACYLLFWFILPLRERSQHHRRT